MGVDHDAVSGYGFPLGDAEKQIFLYSGDEEYDGDYNEALDKFLEKYPDLAYLEAGQYAYTGDDDDLALAIVVSGSYMGSSMKYNDPWWNYVEVGSISPEEQKQLEDAADALAIDNPKFGFVSGIHTW
jgi:hypothetical protein